MCLASILGGSLRVQNTVAAVPRHWTVGCVLVLVHGSAQLPGHLHVVDEDEVDDPQGSYFTRSEIEHLGERGHMYRAREISHGLGMAQVVGQRLSGK